MLSLTDVTIAYEGQKTLCHLSAHFQAGKICGVVGKSGSGKTTLAKALAGILPFSGQITLQGEKLHPHCHRIAFVPQNQGLIPWKTVAQNITLPLKIRGIHEPKAFAKLTTALRIETLLSAYPRHISGGEKQRVAMARAFLSQPHLLILDEAFAALDAITKEEARQIFLQTYHLQPVTTLLITHDVEEALTLCHTIWVLREGKLQTTFANPHWGKSKEEDLQGFLQLQEEVKKSL